MRTGALPSPIHSSLTDAFYAFLAEKHRRSGSLRTVEAYSRMLDRFFTMVGKPPGAVRPPEILAFAHRLKLDGKPPSSATVGARVACISSFYRFLIRMGAASSNPCDLLERPKTVPAQARGLSAEEVRRLLAVVPENVAGRRDRAILLTLVLTGRRRTEVLSLTAGDIVFDDSRAFYEYRGKGGKTGRRELPRPALDAIRATLANAGKDVGTMLPGESLWQAGATVAGVSSATFYGRFRRYLCQAGLPATGIHVLRHTAAKLRRDAGDTVESVSAFLDHSSLAVTTTYLRRLEGVEDQSWERVAEAIGVLAWQPIRP